MISETRGRVEAIKKRLITLIETGVGNIGLVTGDFENLKSYVAPRNLPVVSVRVGTYSSEDVTYGRRVPELGMFTTYRFSAHVITSACNESGEDRHLYAQRHASIIEDYLHGRDQHATERDDHDIYRITDISGRESVPAEFGRNLSRVILEGALWVKRQDSP